MIPCPKCGNQLSEEARACPKCGHVMSTTSSVATAVVIGVIAGGFLLWFLTRNL